MTPKNVKSLLKISGKIGDVVNIMGLHGIGKSSVVKQHCSENNLHYEELILSIMEPGDLVGLGKFIETENGVSTIYGEPDWIVNLNNAAWPIRFKYDDLVFNDLGLKEFCDSKLNKENIILRKELNSLYKEYYDILEDGLFLTKNQKNISCKKSKNTLLFCDEFNRALPDTRNASMQLILEKKIHNHYLPFVNGKQTQIVMAMNKTKDRKLSYDTSELDPAQLDRITEVEMIVSLDDFLTFARENNIEPVIMDFLMQNEDRLHFVPEDSDIHSTPRSWHVLSDYLKEIEDIPKEILLDIIKGRVGDEVGLQFYMFLLNYEKIFNLNNIENYISKKSKETSNLEEIGEELKNILIEKSVESIRIKELAIQIENKILKYNKSEDIFNLLVFMYSMHPEVLLTYIKEMNSRSNENYAKIVNLDNVLNKKALFVKYSKYLLSNKN
jgi:hypothetical protein